MLTKRAQETTEFQEAKREKPREPRTLSQRESVQKKGEIEGEAATKVDETSLTKVEELEVMLKRKEAQLQAKDNQITNLRGRLSRAHDTLEGSRQQKLWTK